MDHAIRSNCLAASDDTMKLDMLNNDAYKVEMAAMKESSTAIVKNDFDFNSAISNKIKYVIDFE